MESVKLRSLPLRDQMLVTSDSGAWVVLDKPDYELLSSGKISEDSALYKRLEKELVILTPKNRGKLSHNMKRNMLISNRDQACISSFLRNDAIINAAIVIPSLCRLLSRAMILTGRLPEE